MKLFECQNCGQPLYFENTSCVSCGMRLGFLPERQLVTALQEANGAWKPLAAPTEPQRFCSNAQYDVCNWLVPAEGAQNFCAACRHNRTIPDLTNAENLDHWRKIEFAKHWLFYTLLRLKLPHRTRREDANGLVFDFLSPDAAPVLTGHARGVITLNVAEADDPERERQRKSMREPYRTLLGHFRHEIAHYYWDLLFSRPPAVDEFRQLFGDERQDYKKALEHYYANGPPSDWTAHFVSAYASAHPWEDFAETWAHYFHMVDTLETAAAFGVRVRPRIAKGSELTAVEFDPYAADMHRIIEAWIPLTFAVNSINRSMGQPDLYPFVLAPAVIRKLEFVHAHIHAAQRCRAE
jgi:hypothetical protein